MASTTRGLQRSSTLSAHRCPSLSRPRRRPNLNPTCVGRRQHGREEERLPHSPPHELRLGKQRRGRQLEQKSTVRAPALVVRRSGPFSSVLAATAATARSRLFSVDYPLLGKPARSYLVRRSVRSPRASWLHSLPTCGAVDSVQTRRNRAVPKAASGERFGGPKAGCSECLVGGWTTGRVPQYDDTHTQGGVATLLTPASKSKCRCVVAVTVPAV